MNAQREYVCRRLPPGAEAAGIARGMTREFLDRHVDDDLLAADILVAVSELVTNAVKHGSTTEPVWVHLLVADHKIAVTVTNCGASKGQGEIRIGLEDEWAESGRGLHIVRAMMDKLAVFNEDFTVVRISRQLT